MGDELGQFAAALQQKFSTQVRGEPENQLRGPFEQLLQGIGKADGLEVQVIGETRLDTGGKPDFGVSIGSLLCGHAELKAPGKGADTANFTGHDKKQWERFRNLPNILYSDGREFALYRHGKQARFLRLEGNPCAVGDKAASKRDGAALEALLRVFFGWNPIVPGSSKQLAEYLAPLCRILRDDVRDALRKGAAGVVAARDDWRRYLFPGADDARFADAYAQTVTFSLLLARSNGSDTLSLDQAIASLTHANALLSRALQVLTDPLVKAHLSTSLGLLQRVIQAVPTGTMTGERRDPWLHFYEDFLSEYDPVLRKDAGAYYTPVEVVQAQVRIVDKILRERMGKRNGWASGGVDVLDPAAGTGTYLLGIAEHALGRIAEDEGPGALRGYANLLAKTLYGFEIMVGPYAVAALRLTRMLQEYGGEMPGDGAQIILSNTLESPHEKIPVLPLFYQPIGVEHQRARRVKDSVPILVCIGNPPYDRHAAVTDDNKGTLGGWVRWGELKDGTNAILNDFIDPVKAAGHGGDLKNLYNLYVYFWRWALWKTFEHDLARGPGIVTYISASSFLDGTAFLGMREHMRKLADEIWVIDLGGENRGTGKSDNVFDIETPVAITVVARYGAGDDKTPAKVHYTRIEGKRAVKLHILETLESLDDLSFADCSDDWAAPFRPAGTGDYFDWPLLTDLMPWQTSGSQIKRTWPLASEPDVLRARWKALLNADDRALAFKETRDRKISTKVSALCSSDSLRPIAQLPADTTALEIRSYGYRSFDHQFLLSDNRLGDYLRPSLWQCYSDKQVYFASLLTKPLGSGLAVTVSANVPDLDYFSGRGAKDIIPLYRDPDATHPNLHTELLEVWGKSLDRKLSVEDTAAYFYAVLAQPVFTEHFQKELENRELHVPLTADVKLFNRAVALGRELLYLHSYGERFAEGQVWPQPVVKCTKAVPSGELPEKFAYDEGPHIINVGGGEFGPVAPEVWEYGVSGLKVVQSWLGYRMKKRKGRKSSPLDDITPKEWTSDYTSEFLRLLNILTRTLELHPKQAELLDAILAGPLLNADALGPVPPAYRTAPKVSQKQPDLGFTQT